MHGIEVLRWLAISSAVFAGISGFIVGAVLSRHKKIVIEALKDRHHQQKHEHADQRELAGVSH